MKWGVIMSILVAGGVGCWLVSSCNGCRDGTIAPSSPPLPNEVWMKVGGDISERPSRQPDGQLVPYVVILWEAVPSEATGRGHLVLVPCVPGNEPAWEDARRYKMTKDTHVVAGVRWSRLEWDGKSVDARGLWKAEREGRK